MNSYQVILSDTNNKQTTYTVQASNEDEAAEKAMNIQRTDSRKQVADDLVSCRQIED